MHTNEQNQHHKTNNVTALLDSIIQNRNKIKSTIEKTKYIAIEYYVLIDNFVGNCKKIVSSCKRY